MSSCSKRVPYTQSERLLLASLVAKHRNVLENKRTDANTIQEKQHEWEMVAAEYNAQATLINEKRNSTQLKKLWNNLKQRKKKATTELKYQRLVTGGGPEPPELEDPVMEAMDIAAPHVRQCDITLPCRSDSTGVYEARQTQEASTEHQKVEKEEPILSPFTFVSTSYNTLKTIPSMATPSTSSHSPASTHSRSPSPTRSEREATRLKEESELRVQQMEDSIKQQKELHNIRMLVEQKQLQKIELEVELAEMKLDMLKNEQQLQ